MNDEQDEGSSPRAGHAASCSRPARPLAPPVWRLEFIRRQARSSPLPTVLQGEPITLDYYTWFYNEPGRGDAWTAMIADFEAVAERHQGQHDRLGVR